jgi:Tfp pilus assembly protein PilV
MTANNTHGRIRSALGEHLIAVLIVAIAVLGLLTAYPAIAADTKGTAARAQERANLPLEVASQLENGMYASTQAQPGSTYTP